MIQNVENGLFPSQMMIETFFSVNEQSTNERWVFRGSASTLVSLLFHSPLAKTQKTQNKIFSGEKIGGENFKLKIHNEKTGLNRFKRNCWRIEKIQWMAWKYKKGKNASGS